MCLIIHEALWLEVVDEKEERKERIKVDIVRDAEDVFGRCSFSLVGVCSWLSTH